MCYSCYTQTTNPLLRSIKITRKKKERREKRKEKNIELEIRKTQGKEERNI
jgi:hypothetical protein